MIRALVQITLSKRYWIEKKCNLLDSNAFQSVTFYHQSVYQWRKEFAFIIYVQLKTCEKFSFVEHSSFSYFLRLTYYWFNILRTKSEHNFIIRIRCIALECFIMLRFRFFNWLGYDVSKLSFGCFYRFFRFSWK